MIVEFLKSNNMLEASMLFSMFIIWTLLQQVFRYHGIKKYREASNGNPHPKCKITEDWKDQTRENWRVMNKNLVKIKELMIKHYGDE